MSKVTASRGSSHAGGADGNLDLHDVNALLVNLERSPELRAKLPELINQLRSLGGEYATLADGLQPVADAYAKGGRAPALSELVKKVPQLQELDTAALLSKLPTVLQEKGLLDAQAAGKLASMIESAGTEGTGLLSKLGAISEFAGKALPVIGAVFGTIEYLKVWSDPNSSNTDKILSMGDMVLGVAAAACALTGVGLPVAAVLAGAALLLGHVAHEPLEKILDNPQYKDAISTALDVVNVAGLGPLGMLTHGISTYREHQEKKVELEPTAEQIESDVDATPARRGQPIPA